MSEETQLTGEEVSTPPVDEQVEPVEAEETAENDEVSGLKEALKAAREKARTYETELELSQRQAELYKSMVEQPKEKQPEFDPDDLMTYRDYQRHTEKANREIQEKLRAAEVRMMANEARAKYSDFDEVFELAYEVASKTPGLEQTVMASANPAETAYALGRTHPNYEQKIKEKANREVASQVARNSSKTKTLSDTGGSGGPTEVSFKDMSKEDFEIEVAKAKGLI